MFRNVMLIIAVAMLLAACTPKDASEKDLMSPCVSNDLDAKSPCIRRLPVGNSIYTV
jgi:hypothetical protein